MTAAAVDPALSLRPRIAAAVRAALGDEAADQDPALHRSQHADYQADVALALARKLKKPPRDVATAIVEKLPSDDVIAAASVSGPGFINLTLQPAFIAAELSRMSLNDRLGLPRVAAPETVVVDYSAPNVAKEMHVGHLRPTVIGDAVVRLLEFQGQNVIRQNHIGDWGTPFGMLIEHLLDEGASGGGSVRELVTFYKAARAKYDADPAFAERARRRVVLLQGGDADTLAQWRRLVDVSIEHFTGLYEQMSITLRPEHVRGESAYNDDLPAVAAELENKGLARVSDGALCVFPPGFTGREGEPAPVIVRKSDGGYGYATTDLAAVRYRATVLGATRIIYVVGAPQTQHLAMVFATARMAGWAKETVRLEHVAFGSVLGPDKKMFKTRSGENVSLAGLVAEAIERARAAVDAKSPELSEDERAAIAGAVGIGAIKYADLANDRIKDYVFDWNRMLAFEGNAGPYMMYAHARIRSILRKAAEASAGAPAITAPAAPEERALALALLQFGSTVDKAAESLQPHRVCTYLHDVASAFSAFFEACPVLKADGPTRAARLALCQLTAQVLECGLDLLGIQAPDRM